MHLTTRQQTSAEIVREWISTKLEQGEGTESEQAVMRMVWYGLDTLLSQEESSIARAHTAAQKAVVSIGEAAQILYGYRPGGIQ